MITTIVLGAIPLFFYSLYYLLTLRMSSKSQTQASKPGQKPRVSVVVPAYNEEAVIENRLANLCSQDYRGNMEIVVIDDGSQDRTADLVRNFISENNQDIRLLSGDERQGKAAALNEAFARCSGDIIVMTDADTTWEDGALTSAVSRFSNPDVGAVTGRQVLLNPSQTTATKSEQTYRGFFETLRIGESALDSTPIFNGPLSCYRKVLIRKISENSMADDSELAFQVRKQGYRCIYNPESVFYEYTPFSLKSRFTQKVRRAQGLIQLFWRERRALFNRRYGRFGTIVFPAEFFMIIVSPLLLTAFLFSLVASVVMLHIPVLIAAVAVLFLALLFLTLRKVNPIDFAVAFFDSQFTLLIALTCQLSGRSSHKWVMAEEVRELAKADGGESPRDLG
ncbi:glycosyltransferase [Chloroflexota bacterium]